MGILHVELYAFQASESHRPARTWIQRQLRRCAYDGLHGACREGSPRRLGFSKLSEVAPEISFKSYTTNTKFSDTDIIKIPLWLLGVDDLALLLGVESHNQIPIVEKALKIVSIFGREESEVIKSKNDIIARAILDILTSGRSASQIRDQVVSVLSYYNTKELNLETQIFQPGWTCLPGPG